MIGISVLVGRLAFVLALGLPTPLLPPMPPAVLPAADEPRGSCRSMIVTGYVRTDHGTHTFDGTPITTPERIVAASWDIAIDSRVVVADLGSFRVADRGQLGRDGWIDVAVWSKAEAFALTSVKAVCVYPPGAA